MPNNKSFVINAEFMINRKVWRTLGYGDQPSKVEVGELMEAFLATVGTDYHVKLKYMGAPGHYRMGASVTVVQPWWKRMGLGDSASVTEVKQAITDFLIRVARERVWSVGVELQK